MLVTEVQPGLDDLFRSDSEIVTYSDEEDCVAKIKYYQSHETERTRIARAGQQRTLDDHNFLVRMRELDELLNTFRKSTSHI